MLVFFVLLLVSCKKEVLNKDNGMFEDSSANKIALTALSNNKSYTPLTVITVAGVPHTIYPDVYYRDGIGKDARFNSPFGIDLANDKVLYITDPNDNANNGNLRKITLPNVVTTVTVPHDNFGNSLDAPVGIGVANDGTINISAMGENQPRTWLMRPNNSVVTTLAGTNRSGQVGRDTKGAFWFNQNLTLKKFGINSKGEIGTDSIRIPRSGLCEPEASTYTDRYGLIFRFAYNGVLYVVPTLGSNANHMYKYTPSGVFARIYPQLTFHHITCIISNKDSRTLYIADNGAIKSISNGKLHFLAGPNTKYNDGRDGVGSNADVYANSLALSRDENTIYFTDQKGTVRKLILK